MKADYGWITIEYLSHEPDNDISIPTIFQYEYQPYVWLELCWLKNIKTIG